MSLTACPEITERNAYMPKGFMAILFKFSGEEIDIPFPLGVASDVCPLNLIAYNKVKLKPQSPVMVKYVSAEDGFIAENENLNIHAFGQTRDEALNDFKAQLVHLFFHYRKKKMNELTGLAKDLKCYYRDNFQEV